MRYGTSLVVYVFRCAISMTKMLRRTAWLGEKVNHLSGGRFIIQPNTIHALKPGTSIYTLLYFIGSIFREVY